MTRTRLLLLGAAALAIGLAACGGDKGRDCAAGTVPDPNGANTCVPDGTVICGNGTTYDPNMGKCVAGGQCPQGEVLVNGECAADVTPDAEEATEPNDQSGAGAIVVPAVGAKGYVVHGCITPRDASATADVDPWTVTVTGPTLLDVTSDGVGGLAAGFVVTPDDPALAALQTNGWVRFGINLVDDTSHRQLYLPVAGTYTLTMSDSRQLFLGNAPAGSDKACYYTTVSQLEIPSATAITGTSATGTIGNDVQFFSVTPTDGDLFFASLTEDSQSAIPAIVTERASTYFSSADASGAGAAANSRFGGAKASETVVYVVDSEYNYSIAPVNFTLSLLRQAAPALPTGGQVSTITQGDGTLDTYTDLALFWFDANAGDVMNFKVGFDDDANFMIMNSNLDFVGFTGTVKQIASDSTAPGLDDTGSQTTNFQGWYHFKTAGRYYVAVYDPDLATAGTVHMTSTVVKATVGTLTVGTPVVSQTLGAANGEWFNFDPTTQKWIAATGSGTNIAGNVVVDYYASDAEGLADADFTGVFTHTFAPAGATHGRITFGDTTKYIVRVSESGGGTPNANAKFSLDVHMQTFVDLGTVDENTPANKLGEDLGGTGKTKLYFLQGNQGDKVTIVVHPTAVAFKGTANWLNVDEGTKATATALVGQDVTLTTSVGKSKFIAFAVTGTGATTTYDVHVTAAASKNYTMATGTLAYTDICNGGANEVTMSDTDEGLSGAQTMPFAFNLFGDAVTQYTISTNGWLAFRPVTDSAFNNQPIPTEGEPDGLVAPLWTDVFSTTVCKTQDANKVTIQWTGFSFNTFAAEEFQAVMHKDGSVDFIWGTGHEDDGSAGTVGLENTFGTFGKQSSFNTAGSVAPGTSLTFTPVP